jgi:hypothetical protein
MSLEQIISNNLYFILAGLIIFFIVVVIQSYIRIKYRRTESIDEEYDAISEIDGEKLKVVYGIAENLISDFMDTHYSLYLQEYIEDPTNELLENEYLEYKAKFIKQFIEVHGKSELISMYILLYFSNVQTFIKYLEEKFDVFLKLKYINRSALPKG